MRLAADILQTIKITWAPLGKSSGVSLASWPNLITQYAL